MAKIITRKRGSTYQYRFEIASVGGVRKWIYKSGFKTKKEAEIAGAEAMAEYKQAGAPCEPCNMSYADYLDYWLDNHCRKKLRDNTVSSYETYVRLYIKPSIGKYRLADINTKTIQDFIDELVEKPKFVKSYYQNILKVVKGSFKYAIKNGFLKYNPSVDASVPIEKYKRSREKHVFSQEDVDLILERFKNNREFICAFLTAIYTGMRTGEVLALTWNDINFDKGFINVEHSVYDQPKDSFGRWYYGPTKTEAGERKIPLCNTLKEALLNYKKYQELTKQLYGNNYKYYGLKKHKEIKGELVYRIVDNDYSEENVDFVFTREDGKYSGTDILKDPIKIINEEFGIKCRFYDSRGSFATNALYNGNNIVSIAKILGHADIATTSRYYLRSKDDAVVQAIRGMDALISSNTISNAIKFEAEKALC